MNRDECEEMPATARGTRRARVLAEITLAVTIAGVALLAPSTVSEMFTPEVTTAEQRAMAAELAAERVHAAREAGAHADTLATLESSIPGYPGFTRVTAVRQLRRAATDSAQYRVVTTAVLASGLPAPVRKMAVIRID